MIEIRWLPGIVRVACTALLRKAGGYVIRIRGILKISLMARETIFCSAGKAAVHVTLRAGCRRVRANERKSGTAMVKRRRLPGVARVACAALLRKARSHVIRICGIPKISLVAREAIFGRTGEAAIHVAPRAVHRRMRTTQRECCQVMIKIRRRPGVARVTNLAVLREVAGHMIGIRGVLKISLMARETIFRSSGKAAVHVTLPAIDRLMGAHQGKTRSAVIKAAEISRTGKRPAGNRAAVALLTTQRKPGKLMIGICGRLIIRLMANAALQRQINELSSALLGMAVITSHMLMPAQQWKAGGLMNRRDF